MTFDSHKQHKLLHRLDERMNVLERSFYLIALFFTWLVLVLGIIGFGVTCLIDMMRGRLLEIGWLQKTGIAIFLLLALAGAIGLIMVRNAGAVKE